MAANTVPDIIGSGLYDLYEARADREKKQLDLQRAVAREQMLGRTTVPNVFAQLKMKHEQEQAKAQKIKEAGQPTPASMLPPAVDMTGTPQRGGAAMAGDAAEMISNLVSGGGGVKTGQIGGGPPGGGVPAAAGVLMAGDQASAAVGQAVNAAFPDMASAAAQIKGAPAPQQATAGPPPPEPGSAITEPVGGVERGLSALGGVMALAGRQPGLMVPLLNRAITGKEKTGEHVPSAQEQAAPFAKGLAAILDQTQNTNPIIAAAAQQTYNRYLDRIEQAGGPQVRQTASLMALDVQQQKQEERYWQQQTPQYKQAALVNQTWTDFIESGQTIDEWSKAHPGPAALIKAQAKGSNTEVKVMMPATQADIEKSLNQSNGIIEMLGNIEQTYSPEALTLYGRAEKAGLTLSSYIRTLSPEEQQKYDKYNAFGQYVSQLTLDRVRSLAGATMSAHEIQLVEDAMANMKQDPNKFKTYLAQMREYFGLAAFRYHTTLESGKGVADPRLSMSLTSARNMALQSGIARAKQLQSQGLKPEEARRQVDMEFWGHYGIDFERLAQKGPSLPPSLQEQQQ